MWGKPGHLLIKEGFFFFCIKDVLTAYITLNVKWGWAAPDLELPILRHHICTAVAHLTQWMPAGLLFAVPVLYVNGYCTGAD